ncbi:WG repeat-containing protein [Tenacibaculum finnmarkense genomovar ulcerans]|uniref:WG repeat-containing protein n=1 Tax=Tenacibaculum finnmarkense TaxID=2781243 RepID=UPI001E412DD7|nr:WG repeat-containing protein [Tenacibaculum finnmarkense]MCD8413576.1 WG repeat-containing protein [Tenacibaculum finnmarkense genomovar ulcerans]MCD8433613.1 WG repeat-containing protein [Tenacibaculum finnmarkense genomovar ulcerans]
MISNKTLIFLIVILFQSTLSAQNEQYNIYEIGKGEIFKKNYRYLEYLYDNLLSAIPISVNNTDYRWTNKTGVINLKEKLIVPFQYRSIRRTKNDLTFKPIHNKNQYKYVNVSNGKGVGLYYLSKNKFKQLNIFNYLEYFPISKGKNIFIAKSAFKSSLLNTKEKNRTQPKFDKMFPLNNELISIKSDKNKYGILNIEGDTLLKPKYTYIRRHSNYNSPFIAIEQGDSIGLVNNKSEIIIPPIFRSIESTIKGQNRIYVTSFNSDENFLVNEKTKEELSDWVATTNKTPRKIYSLNKKQAKKIGLTGAFDFKGNLIIPFKYDYMYKGIDNEIITSKNNKFGLLSNNGDVLIDFLYSKIKSSFNKFYVIMHNKKKGVFSKKGKQVLPIKYKDILPISTTKILVLDEKKWYIYNINKPNKFSETTLDSKTKVSYSNIFPYYHYKGIGDELIQNIYFTIEKDSKYGVINNNIDIVISPKHENSPILNYKKFFSFGHSDKQVLYTINGILMDEMNRVNCCTESELLTNSIICLKNNKYGVVDMFSNILIPFEYSYIENIDGKKFIVKK